MTGDLEARCRACQDRFREDPDRAGRFLAEFDGPCACQHVSISPHSPGRVESEEMLARLILDPKHLIDGRIEVGGLRDISGNGLSFQRRRDGDADQLVKLGRKLAALQNERALKAAEEAGKPPPLRQSFVGIVEVRAGIVREHRSNGEAPFCVMDSAETDDPLHADIITGVNASKPMRSKLRNELRNLFLKQEPEWPI